MISVILSGILFCAVFAVAAGAWYIGYKQGIKSVQAEPKSVPEELSEEEKRKRDRIRRETENFYSYDGFPDSQE